MLFGIIIENHIGSKSRGRMMTRHQILIGTNSKSIIATLKKISIEHAITISAKQTLEDFLLGVQQEDCQAIFFDTQLIRCDVIKMVRLIRGMRPKVPLIVILDKIDKKLGGEILTAGAFQIALSPNAINLAATLRAVLKTNN